jgi:phosphatidylserine decarboxylase
MFHKEGTKTILFGLILQPQYYYYLTILLIPCGYRSYFKLVPFDISNHFTIFQKSQRIFTTNENQILSPVDGKVVVIEEVYEGEYYKDKRLQISIFMSPINVHVTRYAISGIVKFSKYHPGKFLVAWHPKASEENERTTIVIENNTFGSILYRQVAGISP